MLLLTSITDLLQVITSQAVTVDVHASWVDNAAGTITPGRTNTAISTAATTTVVASPGASTQRNVQTLNIANKHASLSNVLTIQHTDGTTAVVLFTVTLLAGEELQFLDGIGWVHFDVTGAIIGRGTIGLTGPQGPQGLVFPPTFMQEDPDDNFPHTRLPTGLVSRATNAADAKNWTFLGTATGATVTVGPVIWTGQYRQFMIKYLITGYGGGTPVGRLLIGAATISTTALTNGSRLLDTAAVQTNIAAPSIPGIPLAALLTSVARSGWIFIDGASGAFKTLNVIGQNGDPAVAAPPSIFEAAGVFSDLGTNLLLQRAQLTVYDTLIAVAASINTFTAGTYFSVWGRNND